jgi:TolB protein
VVAVGAIATITALAVSGDGPDDASPGLLACSTVDTDDGSSQIVAFDTAGVATLLTDSDGRNRAPVWSPDGTQIAFRSSRDGDSEIFVVDYDGSDLRQITDNDYDDAFPTWAPDSSRIAFAGEAGDDFEIFVASVEGGDPVQITDNDFDDFFPVWSPADETVAFVSDRSRPTPNFDFDGEIFVMQSDGTSVVQLSDLGNEDGGAIAWSPDGGRIAFSSDGAGQLDLYTVRPDASELQKLTADSGRNGEPSWSPDGTSIAFVSDRDGETGLYLMGSDGGDIRRLVEELGATGAAQWSADGRRLAYIALIDDEQVAAVLDIESSESAATGQQCLSPLTWPG